MFVCEMHSIAGRISFPDLNVSFHFSIIIKMSADINKNMFISVFFMRTPMQRKYATKVAHRRRGEQGGNRPCSIVHVDAEEILEV